MRRVDPWSLALLVIGIVGLGFATVVLTVVVAGSALEPGAAAAARSTVLVLAAFVGPVAALGVLALIARCAVGAVVAMAHEHRMRRPVRPER